jgi:predicted AAA+ superfamily ATPase
MIFDSNPWWKNKTVSDVLCGRNRTILAHLQTFLPYRQMLLITGLRRTGKSTLMYQLIQGLLSSGVPASRLFYFSFDTRGVSLVTLIYFMTRFACPKGIVITKDTETVFRISDNQEVIAIPYWKYHTLNKTLKALGIRHSSTR